MGDRGGEGDIRRGAEEGGAVEEPTREVGESGFGADKGASRGAEEGGAVEEPTREVGESGLEANKGACRGADEGGAVEDPTREVGERGLKADKGSSRGVEKGGAVGGPTRNRGEAGATDRGEDGGNVSASDSGCLADDPKPRATPGSEGSDGKSRTVRGTTVPTPAVEGRPEEDAAVARSTPRPKAAQALPF